MTRLVTTLFDRPEKAREVMNAIQRAGIDDSNIEYIESDPDKQSFFKRIFSSDDREKMKAEKVSDYMTDLGVPEDEAGNYADQVKKGRSLVLVRCQSEQEAKEISDLIRQRAEGRGREHEGAEQLSESGASTGTEGGEQTVQAAEEEVRIGKRSAETGGVRVTKETTEEEVEEDVTLRKEDVDVERKQVDRPLEEGEEVFEDEEIEVSETREEPVVDKETKVREEVTVSKDVEEDSETIRETVRREHINIDDLTERAENRFDQFESKLRSHYEDHYSDRDHDFNHYSRAYRYGMGLAEDQRYRGRSFDEIEEVAGREWEAREGNNWDDFRDAARYGWNRIRGKDQEGRRPRR